ncbi:MAG: leucyl-tRNA synthetase, partial [Patescibacteria group bacterium]|nr:leucyl-tRNA synthetase [Patescibacteria group bacterium]
MSVLQIKNSKDVLAVFAELEVLRYYVDIMATSKKAHTREYDHKKIEGKWQKVWETKGVFKASDTSKKPKFYGLIEFPYPSGDGLHVGHVRSNTAMDVIARKRRAEGYNVLYPIGWDAFGLPTENYAIKTGIAPDKVTKKNTDTFRRQLKSIGFSFDWSREVNTTDPKYYKWTQWIFLQFLKHDLAYKAKININWCPKDKIGLANEEVVNGCCERCGTPVEKREKEQWMLRITKYADRLDKDLDTVNYLEKIKLQQRNWIGRSEGAEIEFGVKNSDEKIKVFTTRPDTIFGATYVVLAPEHPYIQGWKSNIHNWQEVEKYISDSKNKSEIERGDEGKEKTGVELKGVQAINPANQEFIPVFVADYVLGSYGTGAVMAVPAHDERDFAFAQKYNLPVKKVIFGGDTSAVYTGQGILLDSAQFSNKDSDVVKKEITKFVGGKWVTKFKLRDWVFSRQRYWGEPIPVVHCDVCGVVPLKEKDLPLTLPKVTRYEPTDTGESPLASISKWVNTKC